MKKLLLTAVLLLGCLATIRAQSEVIIEPHSEGISNYFGSIYDITNLPVHHVILGTNSHPHYNFHFDEAIYYGGTNSSGEFHAGLVVVDHVYLNGNAITIDSFQPTSVPESGSGLMLASGITLLAYFKSRRTVPLE